MTTDGSSAAISSLSTAWHCATSNGSISRTRVMPRARTSAGMSTSGASLPCSVLPMLGFSWPPVMAVVRLSRMMVTTLLLL